MNIWLIRHGESEANAGLVTAHPATSALTARGHAQAEHIPRAFSERPALIVTSPYIRTKQTAQPTIERFAGVPQEEWLIQEFTFLAPIHYENTSYMERRPMVESFWKRCDPAHVDGEGAESFVELMDRVQDTLERLERLDQDGLVAVFTHGLFIRAALWLLLAGRRNMSAERMRSCRDFMLALSMPNAAILKLRFAGPDEVYCSNFVTSHLPAHLIGPSARIPSANEA